MIHRCILDERRITRPVQSGHRRCNPCLWLVVAHRVLIVAVEHAGAYGTTALGRARPKLRRCQRRRAVDARQAQRHEKALQRPAMARDIYSTL